MQRQLCVLHIFLLLYRKNTAILLRYTKCWRQFPGYRKKIKFEDKVIDLTEYLLRAVNILGTFPLSRLLGIQFLLIVNCITEPRMSLGRYPTRSQDLLILNWPRTPSKDIILKNRISTVFRKYMKTWIWIQIVYFRLQYYDILAKKFNIKNIQLFSNDITYIELECLCKKK